MLEKISLTIAFTIAVLSVIYIIGNILFGRSKKLTGFTKDFAEINFQIIITSFLIICSIVKFVLAIISGNEFFVFDIFYSYSLDLQYI